MKLTLLISTAMCLPLMQAEDRPGALRFKAGQNGEFEFDTGVLAGKIRPEGKSLGLSSLVHIPTGLAMAKGFGILSYYRVFSGDKRYGRAAWDWPSEAKLQDDGSLEVHWLAADDRPFELWSVYRWAAADTLDFETRVRPRTDLPDFEMLVSAYFSPEFTQSAAYAKEGGKAAFLASEEKYGHWQLFPRDAAAAALIGKGRYKLPPNPVDWVIRPTLAHPLAMRRAPEKGVAGILMADPAECMGLAMPFQTDPHNSIYYVRFGHTIKAGETARSLGRFEVAISPSGKQVVERYQKYIKRLRDKSPSAPF